ncbi:MAG: tryptophan-rich sensory protein [Rubrivivax sp.]|nr:tryptophan-rich sensory protein [Rubrivivax sp.]
MESGKPQSRRETWRVPVLCAGAAALLVAVLGGLATQIGPWYLSLRQPAWKPSDLWFGPAWTMIYSLIAASAARAWVRAPHRTQRLRVVIAYGFNGLLNVAWSVLFFSLRRPDWALAQVVLLWLSIAALAWWSAQLDRWAGLLLLPYLAWVSFAAALNAAVVQLNGPF